MVARRFDVHWVALDPTVGSEIQKTRPCVIVSPDELNERMPTVIVAPMTTRGRLYPTRVSCRFDGKDGRIVLDQLCTVDKRRLLNQMGTIDAATRQQVLSVLAALFAP